MDSQLFQILTMFGALGMFLYGMKTMSDSLQKLAGDKLRSILAAMTSNVFKRVLVGLLITVIVQSSSATTVMVVSFVNAGLINLTQAIGMIMGANIGTTATVWLISLFGFKVDLGALAIPLIGLGFPLMFTKNPRLKSVGEMVVGFSMLFLGLDLMKKAMSGLQSDPSWLEFLSSFSDLGYLSIIIFVLIGTLLTVVIQASSATMAITIIMCNNGWIPFDCALAMVLGENIGTTITANLAAIVANTDAKRAAMAHLLFNVFGVIWMLFIFRGFERMIISIVEWGGGLNPIEYAESRPIALSLFHSMFNITNTLALVWFTAFLGRCVKKLVPQKEESVSSLKKLDRGIVTASQLSIVQVRKELVAYAQSATQMFGFVRSLFGEKDKEEFAKIYERIHTYENISDNVEVEMYNYLTKTYAESSGDAFKSIQTMQKVISDIESMADSNYRLARCIKKNRDHGIELPGELRKNVNRMFDLVEQALAIMNKNVESPSGDVAQTMKVVYELEQEIDGLRNEYRSKYLFNIDKIELQHNAVVAFAGIISEAERFADLVVKVSEHSFNVELHTQPDEDDF